MTVVRKNKSSKSRQTFWRGPEIDGVTQSLLSRFLVCRERFRVLVVDGLQPLDKLKVAIEYGNMWHICEDNWALGKDWKAPLLAYARELAMKYREEQETVDKWYRVCCVQFPIYAQWWSKEVKAIKSLRVLLTEESFAIPYRLPSGRLVTLRGKWDGVFWRTTKPSGLILQENKTKGNVEEYAIQQQLLWDLQTGVYLVALREWIKTLPAEEKSKLGLRGSPKVRGVLYNVIRRPLSGGRGTIRPHQATKNKPAETMDEYYARLAGIIGEEPAYFFLRWDAEYTEADLDRFQERCLDPILEQLWDWWEWIVATHGEDPYRECGATGRAGGGVHFRYPYGVWNPMLEGRAGEVDEYLNNGSTVGLEKVRTLYNELEE